MLTILIVALKNRYFLVLELDLLSLHHVLTGRALIMGGGTLMEGGMQLFYAAYEEVNYLWLSMGD